MLPPLTNCDPGDETETDEEVWDKMNIEDCEAAAQRFGYKNNDEMMQAMGC